MDIRDRLPFFLGAALFVAAMLFVYKIAAPYVVASFGLKGCLVGLLLLFFAAVALDRH